MSELMKLSESEEMYLVTLRKFCEDCASTPVPIPDLARALGVQPVSVNQMVNKLADMGLVKYLPYKGVELTADGRAISTRILRHRRLWEVFLVSSLQMDLDEAERLACQLEHLTAPDVANRLAHFLDYPTVCFHGEPIPQNEDSTETLFEGVPLTSMQIGQYGQVTRINTDTVAARFLADAGVRPGMEIGLVGVGANGDVLLESPAGRIQLSAEMSSAITVGAQVRTREPREKKEHSMAVPLCNLKVGEKGIIQKMNFKGAIRQRLLAMGLVIGETILVKRVAPLGDPIDFVVKGYDLSLRKSEASEILVIPA